MNSNITIRQAKGRYFFTDSRNGYCSPFFRTYEICQEELEIYAAAHFRKNYVKIV